jgi:hypothetical protein
MDPSPVIPTRESFPAFGWSVIGRFAIVCFAVGCLVSDGWAQSGAGDGGGGTGASNGVRYEWRSNGLFEVKPNRVGSNSARRLSGASINRLRKTGAITITSNNVCRATVHSNPRRLSPGQSGTLKVLVTLRGDAVALSESFAELVLNDVRGFVCGKPVVEVAPVSTRAGRFLGKPVHDDYILFHVPVTVADDLETPLNIYVGGLITLDLHDGKTGAEMGRFYTDVAGLVKVGTPLPQVEVAKPSKSEASGGRGDGETGRESGSAQRATSLAESPRVATADGTQERGSGESRSGEGSGPRPGRESDPIEPGESSDDSSRGRSAAPSSCCSSCCSSWFAGSNPPSR